MRYLIKTLSGALLVFVVGITTTHAATISQTQINAVVSLLQSFGADADTVGDVQASLGGGDTLPPESQQMMQVSPPPQMANQMPPQSQSGSGMGMLQAGRPPMPPQGMHISSSSQMMPPQMNHQNGMMGTTTTMMMPPRPMERMGSSTGQMQHADNPGHQGAPCVSLSKNLKIGSRGDEVKRLQQMLQSNTTFQGGVTGYFGSQTAQAVAQFQTDNNISASGTGVVGPLTRQFFKQSCGATIGAPVLSGTTTQAMQ